jgi:BirA family biotin operon repressor/biotin-[acetyl-CoA-carboxylase] ligase
MAYLFNSAQIVRLKEVDSTNAYLKKKCQNLYLPEGFGVQSEYQTLGRGQFGNGWESERGQNLLFSYLLRPKFLNAQQVFYLSMSVCLAIYDTVSLYAEGFHIKWPNDVVRNGKKYSGVLIENQLSGSQIQSTVVGVGLNVNQMQFKTPHAASLAQLKGVTLSGDAIKSTLLDQLEKRYQQLRLKQFKELKAQYLKNLYGYHNSILLKEAGQMFSAQVVDVNEQGYLTLQKKNGAKKQYGFKEIEFVLA